MRITVAKSAGFCYGVRRAVEIAEKTAEENGGCFLLGDLIHNRHVVEDLERRGARKTAAEDLRPGDTVVIRSHGENRRVLEDLARRGVRCVDATCPNVRRIQELARKTGEEGRQFLLIGEPDHPEVRGILSWCPGAAALEGPEAARRYFMENTPKNGVTVAAQTTCVREIFESSWEIIKKECTNAKKFDTICNATRTRQEEAASIAAASDVMVVAGDRKSANTAHLSQVCREHCARVYQIETGDELPADWNRGCATAGLTAGASTPAGIMKEVYAAMSEEIKATLEEAKEKAEEKIMEAQSAIEDKAAEVKADVAEKVDEVKAAVEEKAEQAAEKVQTAREIAQGEVKAVEGEKSEFEKLLDESFKTLNTGEKVTGTVTAITNNEVQVDVGAKQSAYIKFSELSDDPSAKPEDIVKVGDEIEAYIVRVNDVEGYAELSKKRLDAQKKWEDIEKAVEDKTIQEGVVTEENKGGIVVSVDGVRVFVPASQSGKPRGADLSAMKGEHVRLRITEFNRARRRVVGSIRAVADEERRAAQEQVWSNIEVGKRYTGTVKSMTSYGVFVDIGGVDGMVHISELSWSRIKDPKEVCKVGDTLEVYVINFDSEKRKISLGVKDHSVEPWSVFMNTYSVGDVADVRVVKLMTFGAFAEVVPGVDGLIHISQIADHRVEKPEDVLTEGQHVKAKITAVDEEKRKISLSMRAVDMSDAESADAEE